MTEPSPADLNVSPSKPSFWRNLSFVWLVPVLALIVSLGIAWQSFASRGVMIEITFQNAQGVTAGETTLRYRDVVIGTVEQVTFTEDLSNVLVRARVDKEVAPFLDKNAQFWVVRPKVSARGISGLSTVLSGVYIEGAWDQELDEPLVEFVGSDGPSLVQPGREGKRVTLVTNDGSLITEGAPVFFHGIEVGRLERPRLTISSDSIVVDAFIDAPHDRRLNSATRFWDTSGFTVSLGGQGLSVDFKSISSLLAGGVEFDTVYQGGTPVSAGHVFNVYLDEATARKSLFARTIADAVAIGVEFGESVSGLQPGADVQFGGLKVGEVTGISAQVSDTQFGPEIRLLAEIALEPDRLGLRRGAGRAELLDFLEGAVENGLRAQLATANLFSSSLIVELVEVPDATPAVFQRDTVPLPIMPSQKSSLPDFTATAEGMLERINALPIEQLVNQAISLMASIEAVASAEGTLAAPDAVVALLEDTRALVNDEATKALPSDIRSAVAELRSVITQLKEGGALTNLASAMERANKAVDNIASASEEFPALVADLRSVAAKANSLEAEELLAAATRVLNSADAVIGTDAARALPPSLTSALNEIRQTLSELRAGGAVENANATMASARNAADSVAKAAESLPELSERLQQLVAQSEALLASYSGRSDFSQETLAALREVRRAAKSVSQLARAIERNPNSLLMGR
ncbi:MAG: MlaD family protein [Paracoccaceae bacterium]|nr:MlaD family protein [Paracoccaceae bacterium]